MDTKQTIDTSQPALDASTASKPAKENLPAWSGLDRMQNKNYRAAAEKLIVVDVDAPDFPGELSPRHVAVCGTLCSLASFNRLELKNLVLTSTLYRKFLDTEPKLVELLQKFVKSEFGACMDILNWMRDPLYDNVDLEPHLDTLYRQIRHNAIVQYFHPYLSASIPAMAREFRSTTERMESDAFFLIEKGLMQGRIDSFSKVIYATFTQSRQDIYNQITRLHKELTERINAILLRGALQNHKIFVGYTSDGKGNFGMMKGRRRNLLQGGGNHHSNGVSGGPEFDGDEDEEEEDDDVMVLN